MSRQPGILLAYYGDDFTGSTDVLEALTLGGVRAALFLDAPRPEELSNGGLQAVGIAGVSRSMTPAQMDAELPALFARLRGLRAAVFHYKICSTFDSSPDIGSIGRAIDLGQSVFRSPFVPLVVGVPRLRRYCLFGNLFASVGNVTYRLDRHPTMPYHPITPMHESDLRLHLDGQTRKSVALFDILHLSGTRRDVSMRLGRLLKTRPDIVLFDVLDELRLAEVGRLIWEARPKKTLLTVGSSGLTYALTAHWRSSGLIRRRPSLSRMRRADRLLVVSGSCSPVTCEQIMWATAHGFEGIALDVTGLLRPGAAGHVRRRVLRRARTMLESVSTMLGI